MTAHQNELQFLIVDDDQAVRQILCEYLKSFGFAKVLEASDAFNALKLLETNTVDFIISDWEMPGMNGIEFFKNLRSKKEYDRIPFIVVTSPVSQERIKVQEAASAKVDAYLIKPFKSQVLRDKITEILAKGVTQEQKAALVVDDDPDVRSTVVEMLENLGFSPIYQAADGDEALTTVKLHAAEMALVVSDWEMPKMAGIELLNQIRKNPQLQRIPFLMITSQSSIDHMKLKQAIEAQADHYLMKPFSAADLKGKVHSLLKKASTDIEIFRRLSMAKMARSEKRPTEASAIYQEILATDPGHVDALLGLSQSLLDSGVPNYESSLQLIRKAIQSNPGLDESYIVLAQTYERAMSTAKALSSLQASVVQCPFSEKIRFHLGRLLIKRGRAKDGIMELKKAIELKPDYAEAIALLQQSDQ